MLDYGTNIYDKNFTNKKYLLYFKPIFIDFAKFIENQLNF